MYAHKRARARARARTHTHTHTHVPVRGQFYHDIYLAPQCHGRRAVLALERDLLDSHELARVYLRMDA